MNNTAEFRRSNRQPGYQRLPRAEYVQRAHEINPRGERLARALTANDVRLIRANVAGLTDKQQAQLYGVSASMIFKIRKFERWGVL